MTELVTLDELVSIRNYVLRELDRPDNDSGTCSLVLSGALTITFNHKTAGNLTKIYRYLMLSNKDDYGFINWPIPRKVHLWTEMDRDMRIYKVRQFFSAMFDILEGGIESETG